MFSELALVAVGESYLRVDVATGTSNEKRNIKIL